MELTMKPKNPQVKNIAIQVNTYSMKVFGGTPPVTIVFPALIIKIKKII